MPPWTRPALAATADHSVNSALYRWSLDQFGFVVTEALVYGVGGTLALAAVAFNPAGRRVLSGRLCRLLGRLSFPIYLLHLPVLLSVGCYVFCRRVRETWAFLQLSR